MTVIVDFNKNQTLQLKKVLILQTSNIVHQHEKNGFHVSDQ